MRGKKILLRTVLMFALVLLLAPVAGIKTMAAGPEILEVSTPEELHDALQQSGYVYIQLQGKLDLENYAYDGTSAFPTGTGTYDLDLNGYDIYLDKLNCTAFEVNGSLMFTSTVGNTSQIVFNSTSSLIKVNKGANLILDNANITYFNFGGDKIEVNGGGVAIHGGKLKGNAGASIHFVGGDCSLTVDGGFFLGGIYAEKEATVKGTLSNMSFEGKNPYSSKWLDAPGITLAQGQKILESSGTKYASLDNISSADWELYITAGDYYYCDDSIDFWYKIGDKITYFVAPGYPGYEDVYYEMKVTDGTYLPTKKNIYEITITGKNFDVQINAANGSIEDQSRRDISWYIGRDNVLRIEPIDKEYIYGIRTFRMKDYALEQTGQNAAPWSRWGDIVESISVEGINYIGDYAFAYCTNAKSISIDQVLRSYGKEICPNYLVDGRNGKQYFVVKYAGSEKYWRQMWSQSPSENLAFSNWDANSYSGYGDLCGEKVYWTWNPEDPDGILYIHGTGPMDDYSPSDTRLHYTDLYRNNNIKRVIIEKGVTSIGAHAFCTSHSLSFEDLLIADSVTTIGDYAFYLNESLHFVDFSAGLKSIGNSAFEGTGVEVFEFHDGLETLGDGVFLDSAASVVYLPSSLKTIGDGLFSVDSELKRLVFEGNQVQWERIEKGEWNPKLEMVEFWGMGEVSIAEQPENRVVELGKTTTFSVKASSYSTLTYYWEYSIDEGKTWEEWLAADADTPEITVTGESILDGALFRCIVSDSAISNSATLKVEGALAIVKQPANVKAGVGEKVSFSVEAEGSNLTYQWQYKLPGSTEWKNSSVTAAKSANFKFTVGTDKTLNGRQYRCVVKDATGKTVTSNAATLTVQATPEITTQPKSVTATAGDSVTFSVVATGEGLTYQWQYKNASATAWSNSGVSAAKSANFKFTVGTDKTLNGRQYRCVVKDATGKTVTSNAATLTVGSATTGLVITTQPKSVTAKAGDSVTFSVVADGDGLTYQWQYKNASASTWSNSGVSAAKSANFKFTVGTDKALNGRQYRCVVKDATGKTVTSNAATLTVGSATTGLAITTQPKSVTAKAGDSVTFSVVADGDGLTYQWQYKNASASTWSNSGVSAAKSANFKFTVGTDKTLNGRQYRCVVKEATGKTVTSSAATLTVTE